MKPKIEEDETIEEPDEMVEESDDVEDAEEEEGDLGSYKEGGY